MYLKYYYDDCLSQTIECMIDASNSRTVKEVVEDDSLSEKPSTSVDKAHLEKVRHYC